MQAYICSMYTSKWTEAICVMPRRRSLRKSCLYCSGWVRNNRGDNVLRLLKSSVATGKMHAGRKQKSGVSGYAMRRWPGRNDVKSGMGKIEPSKVLHPLLRTAFPLYGAAHIKKPIHDSCAAMETDLSTRKMLSFTTAGFKEWSLLTNHDLQQFRKTNETEPFCNTNVYMRQFYKITSYDPLFVLLLFRHSPFCSNAFQCHDRSSLSAFTTTPCPSSAFAYALIASLDPAS